MEWFDYVFLFVGVVVFLSLVNFIHFALFKKKIDESFIHQFLKKIGYNENTTYKVIYSSLFLISMLNLAFTIIYVLNKEDILN